MNQPFDVNNEKSSATLQEAFGKDDNRMGGDVELFTRQTSAGPSHGRGMERQLSQSLFIHRRTSTSSSVISEVTAADEGASGLKNLQRPRMSLLSTAMNANKRVERRRISYVAPTAMPVDSDTFSNEIFIGTTRMNRLFKEMRTCFKDLNVDYDYPLMEKWAFVIYESMSSPSRTFHSVQHVFDISIGADPIQKLAAYFHDVIYYSIDGGLNEDQQSFIGDIILEKDDVVSIAEEPSGKNILMIMDIFGFHAGQVLDPFRGMNEFLSAALAVRCYQEVVDPPILLQIAACIEATIPFRKCDEEGKRPIDHLFERMHGANEEYDLGLSEEELVLSTQRAADLGNRDLGNFATPERAVFLSNTWNLLPESNIRLRNTTVFRISNFATALQKMTGFFEHLDPNSIFVSFRDPDYEEVVVRKTEMAKQNIKVALDYMSCKRLSIAVVAAIAELTGGDAPLALFLGDLPERHHISTSIEDLIQAYDPEPELELDRRVFELLNDGRESESNFDIKNSPLAAYIYSLVGTDGVDRCMEYAVHPMDKGHATALLHALPRECVASIVAACAEIAITRRKALHTMMQEL